MLDKGLGPKADVLAPLAAQKKDVEGGNLEWPEREIVLVPLPHMVHELAHRGSIGRAITNVYNQHAVTSNSSTIMHYILNQCIT